MRGGKSANKSTPAKGTRNELDDKNEATQPGSKSNRKAKDENEKKSSKEKGDKKDIERKSSKEHNGRNRNSKPHILERTMAKILTRLFNV